MPHSISAKKRQRQNEQRRMRNRARRSEIRTTVRSFHDALRDHDLNSAEDRFRAVAKKLDQIAAKGTIHKNLASRRKSRAQKKLNALRAAAAAKA